VQKQKIKTKTAGSLQEVQWKGISTVERGKWKVERKDGKTKDKYSRKWKVERKDGKTRAKINTVESGKWKVESVKSSGK